MVIPSALSPRFNIGRHRYRGEILRQVLLNIIFTIFYKDFALDFIRLEIENYFKASCYLDKSILCSSLGHDLSHVSWVRLQTFNLTYTNSQTEVIQIFVEPATRSLAINCSVTANVKEKWTNKMKD